MTKFQKILVLIALGFVFTVNAKAQPTIFFQPDNQGRITYEIVNAALNQYFGGTGSADRNRSKAFIPSFGAGVTEIGNYAFQNCSLMVLTSLPTTVKKIYDRSFWSCSTMVLTSLPEGLEEIETRAFQNCTGLVTLTLPSTLRVIGKGSTTDGAFYGCTNLTTVTFKSGYTNTLTIEDCAFYLCSKLTKVTLPPMLLSVGAWAFRNCPLNEVHIAALTPPTLKSEVFTGKSPIAKLCVINAAAVNNYNSSPWVSWFGGFIDACYIGIEEFIPNSAVKIYPNPTVSEFTVSFELEKSCNMKILLCDVLGSELLEVYDGFATVGTFTKTVNTEYLAKGVYFLKILIDGNFTVEKIVVN